MIACSCAGVCRDRAVAVVCCLHVQPCFAGPAIVLPGSELLWKAAMCFTAGHLAHGGLVAPSDVGDNICAALKGAGLLATSC